MPTSLRLCPAQGRLQAACTTRVASWPVSSVQTISSCQRGCKIQSFEQRSNFNLFDWVLLYPVKTQWNIQRTLTDNIDWAWPHFCAMPYMEEERRKEVECNVITEILTCTEYLSNLPKNTVHAVIWHIYIPCGLRLENCESEPYVQIYTTWGQNGCTFFINLEKLSSTKSSHFALCCRLGVPLLP